MPSWAQDGTLEQFLETQVTASHGVTPLWLNANKYGLSSLNPHNAYARGIFSYSGTYDKWGIDYKAVSDIVLPVKFESEGYKGSQYVSHVIVQQFYAEVRWKKGLFSIGPKHQPALFRNNELSSGAQTFGINARPVPQGRLELTDWWDIPGTRQWLAFRGHISYGIMSDADWEEAFCGSSKTSYNRWTRYHEKSGYLRFGNPQKYPLTFITGLEMATQFGGTLLNYEGSDENGWRGSAALKLDSGIKSYWNAFVPLGGGGGDLGEQEFQNNEGNQLGSWIFRIDWEKETYKIGLYLDHYFEDHSAMFHADYDGYGTGEEWQKKQKFKFFGYDFKDGQLGLDVKLKRFKYLKDIVIEYINTRYQSGPVYHDHNATNPDHICGMDNYYNNKNLPGWQHWGQAIGNPLYKSPQYNTDGYILFEANRFFAWHGGISGEIIPNLSYRILYSWERAFGTYRKILAYPQETSSYLIELKYQITGNTILKNTGIIIGLGSDKGDLLGNNKGLQITFQYKR